MSRPPFKHELEDAVWYIPSRAIDSNDVMASMYSLVVNRFDVAIMEGAIARQLMDELVK